MFLVFLRTYKGFLSSKNYMQMCDQILFLIGCSAHIQAHSHAVLPVTHLDLQLQFFALRCFHKLTDSPKLDLMEK